MTIGLTEILAGAGTLFTIYIIQNTKLKEGLTDWFLSVVKRKSNNDYTFDIKNHTVTESIRSLKFEAELNEFDNKLKTDLYYYYVNLVLDGMNDLVNNIIQHEDNSFMDLRNLIQTEMYKKLSHINEQIDKEIKLPLQLQEKFDKFRNYLSKQHTYAINNALNSLSKKLLLVQVLDAIDTNSRWFLFYTTEMFENFNGHFDTLNKNDVFINHII